MQDKRIRRLLIASGLIGLYTAAITLWTVCLYFGLFVGLVPFSTNLLFVLGSAASAAVTALGLYLLANREDAAETEELPILLRLSILLGLVSIFYSTWVAFGLVASALHLLMAAGHVVGIVLRFLALKALGTAAAHP